MDLTVIPRAFLIELEKPNSINIFNQSSRFGHTSENKKISETLHSQSHYLSTIHASLNSDESNEEEGTQNQRRTLKEEKELKKKNQLQLKQKNLIPI